MAAVVIVIRSKVRWACVSSDKIWALGSGSFSFGVSSESPVETGADTLASRFVEEAPAWGEGSGA